MPPLSPKKEKMKSYDIGLAGEESAAIFLEKNGYRIIGRRVRIGSSEIDIIAENDYYTVFAEVKTRRCLPSLTDMKTAPSSAVDSKKQAFLIRAAEEYLREHNNGKFFRIDIIEVYADPYSDTYRVLEISHTENAVRKTGRFSRQTYQK